MSDTTTHASFTEPFIGFLPGFAAESAKAGIRPSDIEIYNDLLVRRWSALLDSPASRDEGLLQAFLERHPTLLPGSFSVDGDSGHLLYPVAVISKPKLPGLSDREPDFMWMATDSSDLYPILVEIETPHKRWFYGERAETHSDFTHAQGQLAEWRGWFRSGTNRAAFLDLYEIPNLLRRRRLVPRYVLIYGRRSDYESSPRRLQKRGELAREDERLMSFDRLSPCKDGATLACVRRQQDGYRALAVPPCWSISNDPDLYSSVSGWDAALDSSFDMTVERRDYLKSALADLLESGPVQQDEHELRFRRVRRL